MNKYIVLFLLPLQILSADFVDFYNKNRERYLLRKELLIEEQFSPYDYTFFRKVGSRNPVEVTHDNLKNTKSTILSYKFYPEVISSLQNNKTKKNYVLRTISNSFENRIRLNHPIEFFDIINSAFVEQGDLLKLKLLDDKEYYFLGYKILRVEDSDIETNIINNTKTSSFKLKIKMYLLESSAKFKDYPSSELTTDAFESEDLSKNNITVKKFIFKVRYNGYVELLDLGYRIKTEARVIDAELLEGETIKMITSYNLDTNHNNSFPFFNSNLIHSYITNGEFPKTETKFLTTKLKINNIKDIFPNINFNKDNISKSTYEFISKLIVFKLERENVLVEVHPDSLVYNNNQLELKATFYGAYDHKLIVQAFDKSGLELSQ